MAAITLNILKPSVNNLTVRIFVRAAGLDFEEVDVWGKTPHAGVPAEGPGPPDADDRGARGCPRARSGRAARSCSTSATSTASSRFYPKDPGERAMIDSAMFYLIGTLYPLRRARHVPGARLPAVSGRGRYVRRRRRR